MKLGETTTENFQPDVIIVGVGVAGASLAYSLGNLGLKVMGIERDLKEPGMEISMKITIVQTESLENYSKQVGCFTFPILEWEVRIFVLKQLF